VCPQRVGKELRLLPPGICAFGECFQHRLRRSRSTHTGNSRGFLASSQSLITTHQPLLTFPATGEAAALA
jgi:hypothetical protein